MEGITISPAEVRASAGRISSINSALEDTLNHIKTEVRSLTSSWQSKSADTTQQVFSQHAAKFAEYRAYIDKYAKFLEEVATRYEEAEKANDEFAASFGK